MHRKLTVGVALAAVLVGCTRADDARSAPSAPLALPQGSWTVAISGGPSALLVLTGSRGSPAEDSGREPPPPDLRALVYSGGDTSTVVPVLQELVLPGARPDGAPRLLIGRIKLGGREQLFSVPGSSPLLLSSPRLPGTYLFEEGNSLWLLEAGGVPRTLTSDSVGEYERTTLERLQREGEVILYWAAAPVWSPDGRTVAYASNREAVRAGTAGQSVWTLDLESGRELRRVSDAGRSYRPVGWLGAELLYVGDQPGVWALDTATGRRREISSGTFLGHAADGSSALIATGASGAFTIQIIRPDGSSNAPALPAGYELEPQAAYSRDGRSALLRGRANGSPEIRHFVLDVAAAELTPVTVPAGRAASWGVWVDDSTILIDLADTETGEIRSWLFSVGG